MVESHVEPAVTVKVEEDVAVLEPTATVIVPLVAPEGTVTVNCVAVAAETEAAVPLNFTVLDEVVALKLFPVIVTVVPTAPLAGLKLVIVGKREVTVKLEADVAVLEPTATVMTPLVAPEGMVTTNCVDVADETEADIPLNFTVFDDAVVLKLVPVIVTVDPSVPVAGLKLAIVGTGSVTVKPEGDVAVFAPTATVMVPLVAPEGTVTVNCVEVAEEIDAATPLNFTVFDAAVVLKLVPVIVTVVPSVPDVGLKPVIVGVEEEPEPELFTEVPFLLQLSIIKNKITIVMNNETLIK